jgi:hypothetical protein
MGAMQRPDELPAAGDPVIARILAGGLDLLTIGGLGLVVALALGGMLPPGPLAGVRAVLVPVAVVTWAVFHWWWTRRADSRGIRRWLVYLGVCLILWVLGFALDHGFVVMALPLFAVAVIGAPPRWVGSGVAAVAVVMLLGQLLADGDVDIAFGVVGLATGVALLLGLPVRAVVRRRARWGAAGRPDRTDG